MPHPFGQEIGRISPVPRTHAAYFVTLASPLGLPQDGGDSRDTSNASQASSLTCKAQVWAHPLRAQGIDATPSSRDRCGREGGSVSMNGVAGRAQLHWRRISPLEYESASMSFGREDSHQSRRSAKRVSLQKNAALFLSGGTNRRLTRSTMLLFALKSHLTSHEPLPFPSPRRAGIEQASLLTLLTAMPMTRSRPSPMATANAAEAVIAPVRRHLHPAKIEHTAPDTNTTE